MLVQPDQLGSTSRQHDGAAALKTEIANTSLYRLRSHMDIWNFMLSLCLSYFCLNSSFKSQSRLTLNGVRRALHVGLMHLFLLKAYCRHHESNYYSQHISLEDTKEHCTLIKMTSNN